MFVHVYVCVCVCIYIYIHTHTHADYRWSPTSMVQLMIFQLYDGEKVISIQ